MLNINYVQKSSTEEAASILSGTVCIITKPRRKNNTPYPYMVSGPNRLSAVGAAPALTRACRLFYTWYEKNCGKKPLRVPRTTPTF